MQVRGYLKPWGRCGAEVKLQIWRSVVLDLTPFWRFFSFNKKLHLISSLSTYVSKWLRATGATRIWRSISSRTTTSDNKETDINSGRHLCPEIQINGRMLKFDVSVTECPIAHQRKPPPFLFVLVSVFRLGLRLLFCLCPYFTPPWVMVKSTKRDAYWGTRHNLNRVKSWAHLSDLCVTFCFP